MASYIIFEMLRNCLKVVQRHEIGAGAKVSGIKKYSSTVRWYLIIRSRNEARGERKPKTLENGKSRSMGSRKRSHQRKPKQVHPER